MDLIEDGVELLTAHDENVDRFVGDDGRVSGPGVEQRKLAEVIAGAELGYLHSVTLHPSGAGQDDERLTTVLTLGGHDTFGWKRYLVQDLGQVLQFLFRTFGEQRYLL